MASLTPSIAIDATDIETDAGSRADIGGTDVSSTAASARGVDRTRQADTATATAWRRYDRPGRAVKTVVLSGFALFLLLPIVGMLYFTFRSPTGGFTLEHWLTLFDAHDFSSTTLIDGVLNSLMLVAVTLAIELIVVIPSFVLIAVRFPRLDRAMDMLMLLPIAIPAIILVVGLAPVLAVLSDVVGTNTWTLALAYGVLALPFVHTTISSDLRGLDCRTLSQAAESLGAGWPRTLIDVLLPCLRRSIVASMLITTAIAFGEFTIASLLNRVTLQTALISISKTDVYRSVIVTLIVLLCTLFALFAMTSGDRKPRRKD